MLLINDKEANFKTNRNDTLDSGKDGGEVASA
jgi:hypothetical protein